MTRVRRGRLGLDHCDLCDLLCGWQRQRQQLRWRSLTKLKRKALAVMNCITSKDVQPATGMKRKVIKTMVPRAFIKIMILHPHDPFYGFCEETLPHRSQKFREFYASWKAIADKILGTSKLSSSSFEQRAMRRTTMRSRSPTTMRVSK